MDHLSQKLAAANSLLAPHAVPHQGILGRLVEETDDETRFTFQRDRDRIIHAQAFRRLQGKTQVFVAGEGDHFRTRLTHTMEVAQISRDIARTLGLNEDLCECIALAHDLGHPPFGHAGEAALDAWMREQGSSFEHNEQSLRIVSVLEEHSSNIPGLNLNREVLIGLQKHSPSQQNNLSVEALVVDKADEIAYMGHDPEDGLRAGLFLQSDLADIALVKEAMARAQIRGTSLRGAIIHLLVMDLYSQSERAIGFSSDMQTSLTALRDFLYDRMYNHPRVLGPGTDGQQIIRRLCESFLASPPSKVLELQKRTGGTLVESVKDYVAGMTDSFARQQ